MDTELSQPNTLKCALCGSTFPTNTALVNHKSVHDKENRIFPCNCGKTFTDHCEYLLHEVTHMFSKETRQCSECGENKSKNTLTIHILTHFKKWKQTCDFCGIVLPNDKMKEHAKSHSSLKKQFKCTVCEKSLCESKRTLHMLNHTRERKIFTCEYCGRVYKNKYDYKYHVNKHLGIQNKICDVCGYKSYNPKIISKHMKSHNKICKFECDYCKKTMFDRQQFIFHIRQHTKGFKCGFQKCNFAASSQSELHQHKIKMHYSCKYCCKRFLTSTGLKRHCRSYLHKDNKILKSHR